MRIVSANLAKGRVDLKAFLHLVQSVAADVVAVQEVTPAQAEALAAILPFGAIDAHSHRVGIALRQPGPVRRIPLPGRDAYVAEVAAGQPDAVVEVINVHIIAPHAGPPWRTAALRRGQVAGLEAHLARTAGQRLVLVGDLNATPMWPAYRRLCRHLSDGAQQAARLDHGRPHATWGPWGGLRLLRIDHVLVRRLRVDHVRVAHVPGSDHSAVVAEVHPA